MMFSSPRRSLYGTSNSPSPRTPSTPTFVVKPRPWTGPVDENNANKLHVKRVSLTASAPSLAHVMGKQVVPNISMFDSTSPTRTNAAAADVRLHVRRPHTAPRRGTRLSQQRPISSTGATVVTLNVTSSPPDITRHPRQQQTEMTRLREIETRMQRDRHLAEEARDELVSRRVGRAVMAAPVSIPVVVTQPVLDPSTTITTPITTSATITLPLETSPSSSNAPQPPQPPDPIPPPPSLLVRVSNFVRDNNFVQALAQCEMATNQHVDDAEAWLLGGRIHLYRGDTHNATRWFKQAISACASQSIMTPYEPRAKISEAARKELVRVAGGVEAKTKCVELLSCGKHNQVMPDGSTALRLAESAVEVSPGCASLRVLLGAVLVAMHGISNPIALKEFTQACALSPKDKLTPNVLRPSIQYARLMHRAGLADAALLYLSCVRDVVTATTTGGEDTTTASNLVGKEIARFQEMETAKATANSAYSQGKFEESIELFTKAMSLDVSHEGFNAVLLANRAAAWMALGDFARAVDDCDAALCKLPTFFKARLRRARALTRLSKWKEAVKDFETAYRLNPTNEVTQELEAAKRNLDDATTRRKEYETHGYHHHHPHKGNAGSSSSPSGGGTSGTNNTTSPPSRFSSRFASSSTSTGSAHGRRSTVPPTSAQPPPPPSRAAPKEPVHKQTFYELLGIPASATSAEIKKSYHKLALKHHPDKNVGDPEAVARFKTILDAFNTLKDPVLRRRYDDSFRLAARVI